MTYADVAATAIAALLTEAERIDRDETCPYARKRGAHFKAVGDDLQRELEALQRNQAEQLGGYPAPADRGLPLEPEA